MRRGTWKVSQMIKEKDVDDIAALAPHHHEKKMEGDADGNDREERVFVFAG